MSFFKDNNGDYKILGISFLLLTIVIAIMVLFPFVMHFFPCIWNQKTDFGTMYGVLSALFTGMAFAATYATLLSHQQEIKKQGERINCDSFELSFLRMLDDFKQSVGCIEINEITELNNPISYKGRDALNVIANRLNCTRSGDEEIVNTFVDNMIHIIEYVDNSQLIKNNIKLDRIRGMFSQLGDSERKLFNYRIKQFQSDDNVVNLLEKYGLMSDK